MLQARKISVPTSSRSAFPRALKKIAFPRARVPKTPGTWERESRNARPALYFGMVYTKFGLVAAATCMMTGILGGRFSALNISIFPAFRFLAITRT